MSANCAAAEHRPVSTKIFGMAPFSEKRSYTLRPECAFHFLAEK
jgi:hypothetical protein